MTAEHGFVVDVDDCSLQSRLELEETLIPYPDSFDLSRCNETDYILRVQRPFNFERQVLLSRLSPIDDECHETLRSRTLELVEWYHSQVHYFNDDVLDPDNSLVLPTASISIGFILDELHRNAPMVAEHLLYNDLLIIKGESQYRYVLSRNALLYRGRCKREDVARSLLTSDGVSEECEEFLVVTCHPRRAAIVHGERSHQNALLLAGELTQILIAISGARPAEVRIRKHMDVFDWSLLSVFGIEDHHSLIAAVFEVHPNE